MLEVNSLAYRLEIHNEMIFLPNLFVLYKSFKLYLFFGIIIKFLSYFFNNLNKKSSVHLPQTYKEIHARRTKHFRFHKRIIVYIKVFEPYTIHQYTYLKCVSSIKMQPRPLAHSDRVPPTFEIVCRKSSFL